MVNLARSILRRADGVVATVRLSVMPEAGSLICLLFHSLFVDETQIDREVVNPLQRTTIEAFEKVIAEFRGSGYRFVSADDVLNGLDPSGRHALITFDDGYYNNRLALPVMEAHSAPAIFFISTDNVVQNKCFWWDVLYRNRREQGASRESIAREGRALKTLTTEQIEAELVGRFGGDAFRPRGDIDRPFSPDELRQFAVHPLVSLGNHTANHAILTNYSTEQAIGQIARAQDALEALTGIRPKWIAYPNGDFSSETIRISAEAGLKGAFTVSARRNVLPISAEREALFRLGRFSVEGHKRVESQCRAFRAGIQIECVVRRSFLRGRKNLVNGRGGGE